MPNAETIGHEEVVVQPDFDSAGLLQVILLILIIWCYVDSAWSIVYKEKRNIKIRLVDNQILCNGWANTK